MPPAHSPRTPGGAAASSFELRAATSLCRFLRGQHGCRQRDLVVVEQDGHVAGPPRYPNGVRIGEERVEIPISARVADTKHGLDWPIR